MSSGHCCKDLSNIYVVDALGKFRIEGKIEEFLCIRIFVLRRFNTPEKFDTDGSGGHVQQ